MIKNLIVGNLYQLKLLNNLISIEYPHGIYNSPKDENMLFDGETYHGIFLRREEGSNLLVFLIGKCTYYIYKKEVIKKV
jgi:hypothetical protein